MPSFDLSSDAFFQDPYPTYRAMREQKMAYWMELQDRTHTNGIWMVTRYPDVVSILRGSQTTSVDIKRLVAEPEWNAFDYTLLFTDPPDHTRLRALVADQFSNARVRKLEALIISTVDQLIDQLMERKDVEFQDEFALPLPVMVISGLLGTPLEDAGQLRQWSVDLMKGFDTTVTDAKFLQKQGKVLSDMSAYFVGLLGRKQQPPGSIIADLALDTEAANCSPQEALAHCLLLLVAGHETTVSLLCNGLLDLLKHPAEMKKLRNDPSLIDSAVDEMLRCEAPLQRATFRAVTAPLKLSTQEIPAGQRVSAVVAAANRDPEQFPDPDRFDISRKPNRHLSFGLGLHKCLGERLARTEGRIAFNRLLERIPSIELAEQPQWQKRSLFRTLESLPLHLG